MKKSAGRTAAMAVLMFAALGVSAAVPPTSSDAATGMVTSEAERAMEGPEEFRVLLRNETERWAVIARRAAVRA